MIKDLGLSIDECIDAVLASKKRKFIESVDLAVNLNLNTKKSDHNFRDLCVLPNSVPKDVKVLVVDDSLTEKDIEELKIDFCGGKEILEKIKDGWTDFDVMITTAKMMPFISKLGKILGPKNLMPSPKLGTVTTDLKKAVLEFKKGKVQCKNDSFGNVHVLIGKVNFSREQLIENFNFIFNLIKSKKPQNFKGKYIKSVSISSTMGPSFKVKIY